MNILYIIGNGFDLAQDLKTKYEDFYPYYLKCESPNEAVKLMKKDIDEKVGDWSDMELALGAFTKKVNSEETLNELYFDLSDRLSEYLKMESAKYNFSRNTKIINDFCEPYHYLESLDERIYLDYISYGAKDGREIGTINIVTLNYTNTIEQFLSFPSNDTYVYSSGKYRIGNVCHIHGFLDDTILLGVNDEQQIANDLFKTEPAVRDYLIKKEAIASMRTYNELLCENYINNSDIIVLFGVSLGATDMYLWDKIVNRMNGLNMPLLVYFQHSKEVIPNTRRQLLGRKMVAVRKFLYDRMRIPEKLQSEARILIGYNKDIFKIKRTNK